MPPHPPPGNEKFVLGQRPALDGLRGISVLLVMLCHVDLPWFSARGGFIGVHFFFVLSGFLITTLLLQEHEAYGSISLRNFYARRALRILPAPLVMIATAVLVTALQGSSEQLSSFRPSAVSMLLFVSGASGAFPNEFLLGHTWSLVVEELFYFVWPPVLILLLRLAGRRRTLWIAGTTAVLLACWKAFVWLSSLNLNRIYFCADTNADALMIGVTTALLMAEGVFPRSPAALRVLHVAGVVVVLLIPLGLLKLIYYGRPAWWLYVGGLTAIEGAVALLLTALLLTPLRTLFEGRGLVWVGKVSYGLYLWHCPIGVWADRVFGLGLVRELAALAATLAVTAISFYAIERPILSLKRRFEHARPPLGDAEPILDHGVKPASGASLGSGAKS